MFVCLLNVIRNLVPSLNICWLWQRFLSVTISAYGIFAVQILHMESQYRDGVYITFIDKKCSK